MALRCRHVDELEDVIAICGKHDTDASSRHGKHKDDDFDVSV
jgi:hypothetical protein